MPTRTERVHVVRSVLQIVDVEFDALAEWIVDALAHAEGENGYEFRVGRRAPETSRAIEQKVTRGNLAGRVLYPLFVSATPGGWTDDELEIETGRTHQSLSASRNVLMHRGYVEDSGERRLTRSHNKAIVWTWTGKVLP